MATMFRRLSLKYNSINRLDKLRVPLIQCGTNFSEVSTYLKLDDYMEYDTKYILDEEGQVYLDNLDKKTLERKRHLEFQLNVWQAEGKQTLPSKVTPHNWQVILTQMTTLSEIGRYLKKLYIRDLRLKKDFEEKFENYHALIQPNDDEDLHIIDRVLSLKKYASQWNGVKSILHGAPVVIDMNFDDLNKDNNYETVRQIEDMYYNNLAHHHPCHLHFTSFHKSDLLVKLLERNRNLFADFHRKCVLDVFPKNRLFYLVPEGEMVTEEQISEDTIFVIGGVGDTRERERSLRRARSLDIPYGCFPIDKYMRRKARSTKDLYLQTVINIVVDKLSGESWKVALERRLPDKRFEKYQDFHGNLETISAQEKKIFRQYHLLDKILDR